MENSTVIFVVSFGRLRCQGVLDPQQQTLPSLISQQFCAYHAHLHSHRHTVTSRQVFKQCITTGENSLLAITTEIVVVELSAPTWGGSFEICVVSCMLYSIVEKHYSTAIIQGKLQPQRVWL